MTNLIFNECPLNLNALVKRQGRKILLLIDNAPVHIVDTETKEKLDAVKVQFFSPNLTSPLQTLDEDIIRSYKARVRKYQTLHLLSFIDADTHASDYAKMLNVLDSIRFTIQS